MKLPQMQYGGRVSGAGTIGPGAAVSQARSEQGILNAIAELGAQVAEQKIEYDTNLANSQYADDIAQFERDMATKAVFSADEIRGMGLDDRIDVTNAETGEDLVAIPKYKVYAIALEQRMQDAKELYGQNIDSRKHRQAWGMSIDDANREELNRAVEASGKMAQEHELGRRQVDIDNAILAGKYQTARDLLSDPVMKAQLTPEQYNDAVVAINKAEAEGEITTMYNGMLNSNDVAGLRAQADYLRTEEANARYGALTGKELNTIADKMDRSADSIVTTAETNQNKLNKKIRAAERGELLRIEQLEEEGVPGMRIEASNIHARAEAAAARGDYEQVEWLYKYLDNYNENNGDGVFAPDGKGDQDLYDSFRLMDPEVFAELDISVHKPYLEEGWYNSLVNEQAKELHADEKAITRTNATDYTTTLNAAIADAGLGFTGDSKQNRKLEGQRAEFTQEFRATVSQAEINKNGPLDTTELQKIADDMLIARMKKDVQVGTFAFGISDMETVDVFDQIIETYDIDDDANKAQVREDIYQATRNLTLAGKEVTREAILAEYNRMRGQ